MGSIPPGVLVLIPNSISSVMWDTKAYYVETFTRPVPSPIPRHTILQRPVREVFTHLTLKAARAHRCAIAACAAWLRRWPELDKCRGNQKGERFGRQHGPAASNPPLAVRGGRYGWQKIEQSCSTKYTVGTSILLHKDIIYPPGKVLMTMAAGMTRHRHASDMPHLLNAFTNCPAC